MYRCFYFDFLQATEVIFKWTALVCILIKIQEKGTKFRIKSHSSAQHLRACSPHSGLVQQNPRMAVPVDQVSPELCDGQTPPCHSHNSLKKLYSGFSLSLFTKP